MFSVVMLSVAFYMPYAECRYAECLYDGCRNAAFSTVIMSLANAGCAKTVKLKRQQREKNVFNKVFCARNKLENVSVIEFLCRIDFFQFNPFLQNQFKYQS
jgi:hypothetical protein